MEVNPLRITVIGDDPVIGELKRIADLSLRKGFSFEIQRQDDVNTIGNTHIIYLPENRSAYLAEVVRISKNKPILIVTSKDGLINRGAGINIKNLYWKLRYEINITELQEHNLTADPMLFKLGRVVR